jgi:hypothetical protein
VRKTFMGLLLTAVGVWGYVVFQVLVALLGKQEGDARIAPDASLPMLAILSRARSPLDTTFRDPFKSYLYAQKPAPPPDPKKKAVAHVIKIVDPPKAKVNGILWGDDPVAILQQDGATELVKAGAEIWGLKVLSIDRHQVVVQKDGRKFTLDY